MEGEDKKAKLLARISELEEQVRELEKDLIHDALTGLKTRAFFEEEAKIYLEMVGGVNAGKRKEWFGFKNLSLLFIDIDYFKKINDTYGHDTGDSVLKKVAKAIKKSLRQGDTAARWGGEEIVVILLGANENDAGSKAERIRQEISALKFEKTDLAVTASIGISSFKKGVSFEELVKFADEALYEAKEEGRNKVVIYSYSGKSVNQPI